MRVSAGLCRPADAADMNEDRQDWNRGARRILI